MSIAVARLITTGLSPHRRGNPRGRVVDYTAHGSIPAQAGKPAARISGPIPMQVYPRTGGETVYRPEHNRYQ